MKWATIKLTLPVLLMILLLSATCVWGQLGTSTIRGTITDPSGAALPGATVTITNLQTNLSRTLTTGSAGGYSFESIPPGDYKVEIEAKDFRKSVVNRVQALVGSIAEVSQSLKVGAVSETVVVETSASEVQVNTQDATLGNNIENRQILELPLNNRNVIDLLTLQPGVTQDGYVAGARSDQSNITLDGVDINDAQNNDINGPVLRLNAEAISEFRVETVNSNANEGRSAGAQVNLVSKTGTNNWHGALFEWNRSALGVANDWFNNRDNVPQANLVRNTFGGAVGGPIVKDKAFFFYSFEGMRLATSTPVTRVVPLASLGQGTIRYSYCVDAACTTSAISSLNLAQNQQVYSATGINSAALSALAQAAQKYQANDTSVGDGLNTGGFRFNAPTPQHLNSSYARFDFVPTHNQNVFVRLNVIDDHVTSAQWLPDTTAPTIWSHPSGIAIGHTWMISNNLVNNIRYGYTRQAFTSSGDSTGNDISFRFVFQPNGQLHDVSRVTPVHNITDDVSWTHGKHIFQYGINFRAISNARVTFANAFDNAVTNPSFYLGAGDHVSSSFQDFLTANSLPGGANGLDGGGITGVQNAATAIIGRFSQYTANFTFGKDGNLLAAGTPSSRNFATQAYEGYFMDSWKFRPHLTLTLGLRYSLERPVYETNGFEVQPTVPLSVYFQDRLNAAAHGTNFTDPITVNRSGPVNGGKPMYNWDKNNFQPRVAVAWSPNFSSGLLHKLFGNVNTSVFRGGFAMTNDYYGQALAVDWDLNNTLGFTSNFTTPANTYDTQACSTCSGLAPLFTGFNQNVHSLPNVVIPAAGIKFPLSQPVDFGERIETSVDSKLVAPTEYTWNLTYERQVSKGTKLTMSYIGRKAQNLLARRDVTAFNNIVDPKSGMDWYTAGTALEKQRQQGVATANVAPIPFFENLFPAGLASIMNSTFGLDPVCSGGNPGFVPTWTNTQVFYAMNSRTPSNPCAFFAGNDWTDTQALVDQVMNSVGAPTRFMQPQYGALSAWSTIGNSFYNALTVSLRQRVKSLNLDVNYTFSHSLDDASGLQTAGGFGSAFIVNPIRQSSWYGSSDFDIRHQINASAVWEMPFGKGRAFLNDDNRLVDAVVGGWQLSTIYRWNTGLPVSAMPYDDARWATNWNVQANVTPTTAISTCPDRSNTPKLFGGCDLKAIYQSFRNAFPGETGPRNYLRAPGYMNGDMGLSKSFDMPWNEQQKLQLRWDVFNVANYQPFGAIDTSRSGFGVARDPLRRNLTPPSNWANFTAIQGKPREMQIALRYSF